MSKKIDTNTQALSDAIDQLFKDISNMSPDSEEFAMMVAQMSVLYKLREVDSNVNETKTNRRIAWATIAANVLGIGMIVGHERASVVTSKALAFVQKLR